LKVGQVLLEACARQLVAGLRKFVAFIRVSIPTGQRVGHRFGLKHMPADNALKFPRDLQGTDVGKHKQQGRKQQRACVAWCVA